MSKMLTITQLTFREAWRKKIFWMALALGLAFIVLFAIGFHFILNELLSNSGFARRGETAALHLLLTEVSGTLLILGLFAVNFLIVMMTGLTAAGAIAGEVASHTIQTLASKPLRRWEIVLGKWLGYAAMLVLYTLFMAGGLTLVVYALSGYFPPNFFRGVALMVLEGLVVLSIAMLGSTLFSTLANGVLVFMLYGIAFVGSWVEQIGAALQSETAVQIGIVASLIMPGETMWRIASDLMQSPVVKQAGVPLIALHSKPSPAMVVYAILYAAVLLGLALVAFQKKDL